MNNQGFSNDNLFIGDVRVKGQDETIIIGNENGGNGYILPTEKGTEGQVLTMNADNSTSFQDAAGGGDNVLGVGNGADINIPYAPSSAPVANIIPPSFIGTRRVNIKDIAVGGSVHFYVNSRYNLQIPSAGSTDTFTNILFFITGFRADNTSVGVAAPTIRNNNYFSGAISVPADLVGYLKVEGVITRTATDTFKATVIAFNRRYADSLNPCQIWENVSGIEEINFPAPQDDDYIQWQLQFFNSYYTTGTFVLTNPSVYWTLKNVSTAITPPVSTSDHTQLTNLNLGDAGHTQFALLQGRSGGQVLSGGITPANFLTLKSHTAGLNNIIIKDLNTAFEKNIDMNNNDIINVTRIEGNTGQDMVLYSDDGITVAARDPLIINALDGDGIICQTSSNTRMVITSSEIDVREPINMNGNIITNTPTVSSSSSLQLKGSTVDEITINPNPSTGVSVFSDTGKSINFVADGGNQSMILDGTFITFSQGGGSFVPAFSPTAFDMNNGNINNVSDVNMVNDGNSEISNVFRINGSSVNSLYMIGNLFSATASTQDVIFRCNNPSQCIRFKVGTSATPNRMFICDTDVDCFVPLIMNSNDINNVSNINIDDNGRIENNNNGYFLRNSRDGPTDNIFIAPTENIFFKPLNLQSGVDIIFPFANNQIGHPFIGNKLQALWVNSINGLTPVGGLSSSTSNSAILTASTAEQSILGLTSVGSRLALANSFKQGDAYTATLAGNFSSNNGDTLTLRLKGGAAGTTVLSSIVVPLNGSTNKYFELEINFVVRQIGVATTADLAINYDFSYNQNSGGNFQGERLCEANNTTFDTTIDNQLDITAQFSSTSANNSIETILSTLGKNY